MSKENSIAWFRPRYTWLFWLLIIAVVTIPRVLDLDLFYARDELAIWPWVDQFALAVWQGDFSETLTDSDYPGIPLFWAQTLFLTIKYSFPDLFPNTTIPLDMLFEVRSLELLAERRLVVGLLVSGQILLAVWLVRRLFNWPVALLSAIFMGLDPFGLTEARVLRLEMISAYFVCLTVLSYVIYLRERRWTWLLMSGIMAGLGVSSKTSAGLIVPYIWLLLLVDFLLADQPADRPVIRPSLAAFKRMIADGLIWATGAIGAFWLIWPAMWVKPLTALQHLFLLGFSQAAERSVWGDKVFFWGQIWPGDPGPFFYPVVLAFRTTPLTWIGLISALLFLGFSLLNKHSTLLTLSGLTPLSEPPSGPNLQPSNLQPSTLQPSTFQPSPLPPSTLPPSPPRRPITAVILLLLAAILLILELTFIISKVDRFLLIVFPLLNILSAIGLTLAITWVAGWLGNIGTQFAGMRRPSGGRSTLLTGLIIGLVLVIQLTITVPVHPYYYTYWNPWVGGGRAAMSTLPMGSGAGIDLAMEYLNHQPDAGEKRVVCGASEPWCKLKFAGQTMRSATYVSGEWVMADYATFYISHLQRQNNPVEVVEFFMSKEPLYQVDFQGATYVWVYAAPDMGHFAGAWNDLAGLGRLLGYDFGPPERQVGDTVEAAVWWTNTGAGVDSLVVRWLDGTGYEWGRAPIEPWPEYAAIPPEKRAIVAGTARFTIPPGTPPGLYFLRIGVQDPEGEQLLGQFKMPAETSRLVVQPGPVFNDPEQFSISHRLDRPLAPDVTLLGYTPPDQPLNAERPTWLTLYWQATAAPADYLVTVRLLDSRTGQTVTRWQGKPGHDDYPTSNWQEGEIVRDVWALQVEPETPVGQYDLAISLQAPNQPKSETGPALLPNIEVWSQPISYDLPDMQQELQANFGDRLALLGYDLYFDTDGSGTGQLGPVFYWRSQANFEEPFDLLLRLRQAGSDEVVKTWQVPLGNVQAKNFWKEGEIVTTIFQFEAGALVGGRYHLDVALESRTTGERQPVTLSNGQETSLVRIENIQDKIVVRVVGEQ